MPMVSNARGKQDDRASPAKRKVQPKEALRPAVPKKVAPSGKAASPDAAKPARRRDDEMSFRVTTAFREEFKQAARSLDLKKGAFLENIFREWTERRGADGSSALPADGSKLSPAAEGRKRQQERS